MNKQNMCFCVFVFLILVASLSFTSCGSKPPKSVVENAVFALDKLKRINESGVSEGLTIKITNSFSREVEVPTLGKEKHHFFVSDIVWKNKEYRDSYYQNLISNPQKGMSQLEILYISPLLDEDAYVKWYKEVIASENLNFRQCFTPLFATGRGLGVTLFKDFETTLVKRGGNWYSLSM
jgi:hypothetical protein